jgi:hypothetical protein
MGAPSRRREVISHRVTFELVTVSVVVSRSPGRFGFRLLTVFVRSVCSLPTTRLPVTTSRSSTIS